MFESKLPLRSLFRMSMGLLGSILSCICRGRENSSWIKAAAVCTTAHENYKLYIA